ncbi:hypothetical protein ENSA5_38420 [Enhygromyxa salina]|uniref:Uncharacterized protein n=1 Tax=Enhygromyxa salina TaxID=215803 RepID=A0A2S9XRX3_9BACT|nr:hypothetical protein [Enhygromyxa salina]PRP95490.1 hypothetical protein ENSA5_38420 [Enhygromyxa salina]
MAALRSSLGLGFVLLVLLVLLVGAQAHAYADEGEGDARPGTELITAQVQALETPAVEPGQRGELSLVLLEAPERDLPLAVRVDDSALELVENRLGWSAVVDALALQPRVRVPFTAPAEPGRYEVRASVDYSVCSPRWCRTKRGELRWSVLVSPPR